MTDQDQRRLHVTYTTLQVVKTDRREPPQGKWRQYVAGITACTSLLATGAWFTWPTPLIPRLLAADSPVAMDSEHLSWMVSFIEIGTLLSPFPATYIANHFGRKFCLLISTPFFLVGFCLTVFIKNFISLCAARALLGFASGIPYTILPLYLGEIASPEIRGTVAGFFYISFGLGCLFPYCVGPFLSYDSLTYATFLLNIIFVVCFFSQPESPYYYAMKENMLDATKVLKRLRNSTEDDSLKLELKEIQLEVSRCLEEKSSWKDIIETQVDRKALLLINILGVVSFFSGQNAILTYATETFTEFPNNLIAPDFVTIGIGIVALLGSIISLFITDRLGRRFLLLSSGLGCTISLLIASAYFYTVTYTHVDLSSVSWIAPIAVMAYNLFVSGGIHPVLVTYISELFPTKTRGFASSISSVNLTICSFLVIKLYNTVSSLVGVYFIYLCYTVICLLGTVLFYFVMPETKGKTFLEIRESLSK